ncbi:MAG: GNAT family N-acetyltransferase [Bacillota bacterium]
MIINGEMLLRRMTKKDYYLMVKWLNDPNVLEFYEETPLCLDDVILKFGPRVEGMHYVTPFIVEYINEPIGYMQYYKITNTDYNLYGYSQVENIFGIDQFIGEQYLWGRGLGKSMIVMMLDYICKNENMSRVVLEVKNSNYRAIHCYKKCGFKKVKNLDNELSLMEWTKQ